MRIKTKLLVLILVPLLAVAGVAAVGFGQQSVRSERAEDVESFALERNLVDRAVFAIEHERINHVFNPDAAIDDEIHIATIEILTPDENAIGSSDLWDQFAEARSLVDTARTLPDIQGSNVYRQAIIGLEDFGRRIDGTFLEPEDTARANALLDLFAFFQAQDEAWLAYFAASADDPASMTRAAAAFGEVQALRDVTTESVANQDFQPLDATLSSANQDQLQDLRIIAANGLLANRLDVTREQVTPPLLELRNEWVPVIDAAATDLVDNVNSQGEAADGVRSLFALLGLVGLLLLGGIVFVMYRSIANPLSSLLDRADSVATKELPDLIEVLRNADRDDVLPTATPIETDSSDEIGDLVHAFNEVQLTAYELATEQALGRRHVADMFVNLGRRNQQLLQRILGQLTKLENDEEDPDTLRQLFELDNIVTRMRRNAESLLVLAGAQTPRQWTRPVAIEDAVRAAFGEVEGYERIEIAALADARVRGSVVADLAHLLAELLENAVRFSDPSTPVLVSGQFDKGRYLITVFDQGVGMSPADLEENNRRITDPPSLDQAPTKFLGLFVVGRLAERHDISVRLVEAPGRGIMARVEIPSTLLHADDEVAPTPDAALSPIAELEEATSPLEVEHDPDSELEALALESSLELPVRGGSSHDEVAHDAADDVDSSELDELAADGNLESSLDSSDVAEIGVDVDSEIADLDSTDAIADMDAEPELDVVGDAISEAFEDATPEPPAPPMSAPTPPTPPTPVAEETTAPAAPAGLPTRQPKVEAPAAADTGGLPSRQKGASLGQLPPSPARRKDDTESQAAAQVQDTSTDETNTDEKSGDDAGQFSSLMSAFSSGVSRGLAVADTDTDDNGKGDS